MTFCAFFAGMVWISASVGGWTARALDGEKGKKMKPKQHSHLLRKRLEKAQWNNRRGRRQRGTPRRVDRVRGACVASMYLFPNVNKYKHARNRGGAGGVRRGVRVFLTPDMCLLVTFRVGGTWYLRLCSRTVLIQGSRGGRVEGLLTLDTVQSLTRLERL